MDTAAQHDKAEGRCHAADVAYRFFYGLGQLDTQQQEDKPQRRSDQIRILHNIEQQHGRLHFAAAVHLEQNGRNGTGKRNDDCCHKSDQPGAFAAIQRGDDRHAEDDEIHTDLTLNDRSAPLRVRLQFAEDEQRQHQNNQNNDNRSQQRIPVNRNIPFRAVQAVKELGWQKQLKAQTVHHIQRFFVYPP